MMKVDLLIKLTVDTDHLDDSIRENAEEETQWARVSGE